MKTTKFKRRAFFLLADTVLLAGSAYLAFWVRFDGHIPSEQMDLFRYFLIPKLALTLFLLAAFGLYSFTWRFFGLRDLGRLLIAVTSASFGLIVFIYLINPKAAFAGFPRSVLLVDFLLSVGWLGGLRISKRAFTILKQRFSRSSRRETRILIVGAGAAGEQICREMLTNEKSHYLPVGFIDDDPAKLGLYIDGVKIVGTSDLLPDILKADGIDEVLVALPSAASAVIRRIVETVRIADMTMKIKILPGILSLIDCNVELSDIKEVQLEDVLGRDPVKIDFQEIRGMLAGRRVLVTGAGGSIGSELSRTVLQFDPASLILLDIDETELYHLVHRFENSVIPIVPVIADIRDRTKIAAVLAAHQPEIIFHAAAYKHVPILERYPEEAIKTNIKGTMNLAEEAHKAGVKVFVNISTDKAVNPTSVMGATKRAAEEILRVMNRKGCVKYISVRFGNVIGSRGSVVPLFQEQIRNGGPVTVTHPEMTRYFMAVSEAVLLVLEAAAGGVGGETFILDMGRPIRIADLAREMIVLSGKRPVIDIPIKYTGLRPGEKLHEEILGVREEAESTGFEKIFLTKGEARIDEEDLLANTARLIDGAERGGDGATHRSLLHAIVPTYLSFSDDQDQDRDRW
jgi:FlaA1/EpsC-like NDP-sugar epimerase